jgi:peptidoglycan/LPS O-acetylase OafA/YrhL
VKARTFAVVLFRDTLQNESTAVPMSSDLNSKKHIPVLDGLRGLAVLIVVLYHTGGGAQSSNLGLRIYGTILKAGWSGVTLFFLLSGFLITGILWDSKGSVHWGRNFYLRRVLRISPRYYGSLLLVLVVAWLGHKGRPGFAAIWIFALYLQNLPWLADPGLKSRSLELGHFWSLAVEEQFYLVWPLVLTRLRTVAQVKVVCLGLFFLSMAFRYSVWEFSPQPWEYNRFILSRAGELALGAYLAMCFRDASWNRLERAAPWITSASLAGFVAIGVANGTVESTNRSASTIGLTLITLFYAGFVVLAIRDGFIHRAMKVAWLRWVGSISYGIYVFHILFLPFYIWLARHLAPNAGRVEDLALKGVITWVLAIPIAWVSFRYFESPILGLRKYFQATPRMTGVKTRPLCGNSPQTAVDVSSLQAEPLALE